MNDYDIPAEGELEPQGNTTPVEGQQAPEGQAPAQPAWNGEEWSLKYRGQPYVPKDRNDLINLAQKGFSYTQELERFNKDRSDFQGQLEGLQTKYKHYDDLDAALRKNPELAQEFMTVAQKHQQQPGQAAPEGNMQLYTDLRQRMDTLEGSNTERINGENDRKLSDAMTAIKAQYPSHDWEFDDGTGNLERKLIQFAVDNGISNVDHAYRVMMWDQNGATAKAEALKKAATDKQAATKAGIVTDGRSPGASPKAGYKHGDTYNDGVQRMINEVKT